VSIKRKLGMAGLCLLLALGPLIGGFMRPEDIEELIHGTNQQKIAHGLPNFIACRDKLSDNTAVPSWLFPAIRNTGRLNL